MRLIWSIRQRPAIGSARGRWSCVSVHCSQSCLLLLIFHGRRVNVRQPDLPSMRTWLAKSLFDCCGQEATCHNACLHPRCTIFSLAAPRQLSPPLISHLLRISILASLATTFNLKEQTTKDKQLTLP